MKTNRIIAGLLIVLAFATLAGMIMQNDMYWLFFNCAVILFSFFAAFALLKQK